MEHAIKIHFDPGKTGPFYTAVSREVYQYFSTNKINPTGNIALYTKTAILLSLFPILYVVWLYFHDYFWLSAVINFLLGMDFAGIGFCVMHDGNHGSYSTNKRVNKLMGLTLNLLGGINFFWVDKHNVKHHTYVNVEGKDEDISFGKAMRMSPEQPWYWWHRYQAYYVVVLYGIFYFGWIWLLDFIKYVKFCRDTYNPKMTFHAYFRKYGSKHANFWLTKIQYATIWFILPTILIGWQAMLIGYLIRGVTCGIIISFVFQLAHVVSGTAFAVPDTQTGKLPDEFALHHLKSTSNFSRKNWFATWYLGGLNYQIEHHIFPEISHVHYSKISNIVKKVAMQFNEKYNEQPTFLSAIASHFRHLQTLGKKPKPAYA